MNGKTMALCELTVPYFDLALYELEDFYYNPDCYAGGTAGSQSAGTKETAYGHITMLHMFIFATEVFYHGIPVSEAGKGYLADQGGWRGFSVSGRVGSSYCKFWDFGNNATYFLNYEYPLGRKEWGAACDQILLQTGDVISARYNAHTGNDGAYYHFYECGESWLDAEQGDQVPLLLFTTTSTDSDNGGETLHVPVKTPANIYATRDTAPSNHSALTKVGTTDANGEFILDTSSMEPGIYYITTNTWDPAVAVLEIFPGEKPAVIYGDVSGDESVDASDAAMTYAIVKGKLAASVDQRKAADVDGDEQITATDAAVIYAKVKGKMQIFPVENQS